MTVAMERDYRRGTTDEESNTGDTRQYWEGESLYEEGKGR